MNFPSLLLGVGIIQYVSGGLEAFFSGYLKVRVAGMLFHILSLTDYQADCTSSVDQSPNIL